MTSSFSLFHLSKSVYIFLMFRLGAMMTAEYVLELNNVFHSGQVEPGTCLQKLIGSVRTGVILKDVSLEVHGGELHAVLGSKGSGKRALLEVISRRAQGPTRGNIALNGVPMSMRLFQVDAVKTNYITLDLGYLHEDFSNVTVFVHRRVVAT